MSTENDALARRIRDIVAVATEDIDAVRIEVEDGVAYLEGVVSTAAEARAILRAVQKLPGLNHVVMCLSTERVLPVSEQEAQSASGPQVLMHYYSLS